MEHLNEKIWLKNYASGVPPTINTDEYSSLVDFIDRKLKTYKNRPAYTCIIKGKQKTLSYGEIDRKSNILAAYLQSLGLKKGDRVALMMPNILQYPVALFAVMRAGCIVVNTNPLYTAREIEHQFNDSGATTVVIAENFAHELEKVVQKTAIKNIITVSIGGMFGGLRGWLINSVLKYKGLVQKYNLPGAVKFAEALKIGETKRLERRPSSKKEMICIQYTGGTTGVAKGAVLTNDNLLSNMKQMVAWLAAAEMKDGKEIILTPLPMYHIFSFTVNCLTMSNFGALNVLIPNPRDLTDLISVMDKTRPTIMTGVNTLFNAMLNNPAFCQLDLSALRISIAGAMAVQAPVAEAWKKVTGRDLIEGYGMTEASPVVSANPIASTTAPQIGTIGMPLSSTELRIMGEDGQIKRAGEGRGEIQVKGPQVMTGYYKRPDETAKTMTADGWLRTGDIGVMQEDGFFKIVDRLKDMILVSGFNVYPNEIEGVIAAHPKVLEVAAVGVADAKSSEAVKIFVVKKDASLTEKELRKFCDEQLTGYKKPKHIEFRKELPKSNVGKILRRMLRDEANA